MSTPIKLAAVNVVLTRPGESAETLNVTSQTARRSGTPSPVESIEASWSLTGPAGQPQPGSAQLAVLSGDPTPYPLNTAARIRVTTADNDEVGIDGGWEIAYGRVDDDKVSQVLFEGTTYYRHDLNILDPLQIAADRPVGITRAAEPIYTRCAALVAAHADLLTSDSWPTGSNADATVAALTPDTSLLDQLRSLAIALGATVQSWGSTWALMWPPIVLTKLPAGAGGAAWWLPGNLNTGSTVRIGEDRVSDSSASLTRACRITAVEIGYLNTAAQAATYLVGSTDGSFPTVLQWNTEVVTNTPTTDPALKWLISVANGIVSCPAKPAIEPVMLAPSKGWDLVNLAALFQRSQGCVLEIDPPPTHQARFHVIASGTLTIDPDLTYYLTINPIPAALYGLTSVPFNTLLAADAYALLQAAGVGNYITFDDLRLTYPRSVHY